MMQENIKNAFEEIAEWVRKEGIIGVRDFWVGSCTTFKDSNTIIQTWSTVCSGSSEFTLWYFDGTQYKPVNNILTYCGDKTHVCYIIKKQIGWNYQPLTNSFMSFEDLEFILSNSTLPMLTLKIQARPAIKKWLSAEMLELSRFVLQTTFSERLIETK